jgi:SPP1 gp7 family putative phage head morphogenesis protein
MTFDRLPRSKASMAVLQPGSMNEAIEGDLNAYDYLGDVWRDNFTLAVSASVAKVKRVLNSTMSTPQAVLPLMTEVATTLGVDATAKESAKGLYHAVQLPIRSAVMRSANHASAEVYKTHTDLLLGAMWVTSNDSRVCPICSRQNGRIFVINSLVGIALYGLPPDGSHYGCRCTIIPLMIPVENPNEPPEDSFDEWLDEWGFADELDFFMDDTVLESTQL